MQLLQFLSHLLSAQELMLVALTCLPPQPPPASTNSVKLHTHDIVEDVQNLLTIIASSKHCAQNDSLTSDL